MASIPLSMATRSTTVKDGIFPVIHQMSPAMPGHFLGEILANSQANAQVRYEGSPRESNKSRNQILLY